MDNMFFTKRDEYIFIDYINVIKCPDIFILKHIRDKLSHLYESFIDIPRLKKMSDEDIELFILRMENENIFENLKIKEFDTEKAYEDIYKKFTDLFIHSKLLKIGNLIQYLATNKFAKKIYFYTEKYDERIDIDIQIEFQNFKNIEYVYGDFSDVLGSIIQPTSYILNNQWNISTIDYFKKIQFTDIILSQYKYNLELRGDEHMPKLMIESLLENNVFKFGMFQPFELNEKHTKLIENYMENN